MTQEATSKKFEPSPENAFTLTLSPEAEAAAMTIFTTIPKVGVNLDSVRLLLACTAMANEIHEASHPSLGGEGCNIDKVIIQHSTIFAQLFSHIPVDTIELQDDKQRMVDGYSIFFKFYLAGVFRAWIQLHLASHLPPPQFRPMELFSEAIEVSREFSAELAGKPSGLPSLEELLELFMSTEGDKNDKPS